MPGKSILKWHIALSAGNHVINALSGSSADEIIQLNFVLKFLKFSKTKFVTRKMEVYSCLSLCVPWIGLLQYA